MIPIHRLVRSALALCILSCLAFSTKAQSEYVDSLLQELAHSDEDTLKVEILNELCWELGIGDPKSAEKYGKESVALSKKLDYKNGQSVAHYYLGKLYLEKGKPRSAISETNKALKIDEGANSYRAVAGDHGQLGGCYKALGDFETAAFHYYAAIRIFEQNGDSYSAAQMKLNLANFSMDRNEPKKALQLAEEAKIEFSFGEDNIMLSKALLMEGLALTRLKKSTKALYAFRRALQISLKEEDIYTQAEVTNNIGVYFNELEQYDSAIYYLNKSLELDEQLGRTFGLAISEANLALSYMYKEDQERSVEYINMSIAHGREIGELYDVSRMMGYAADIYYENGDYKKAYDYYLLSNQLKDTLLTEKKVEKILEIEEKYETEKRLKKIAILTKERDASLAKSRLVDTVIYFSIGTILLLIIIAYFFLRQRKAKENQRKAELEHKVLRAQMNPHFIFNSLNSIQRIFIEGDEDLANDYISDFGKLLRIIMENSGRNTVSIRDEIETLKLYLDIEMIRLDGKIDYRFDLDPNLDILNNFIPPLVIQPFVENAIWHGILPKEGDEKGEVTVNISRHSGKLIRCSIIDNGIGISQSLSMKTNTTHNSKGMSLTEERLGNTIQIEDVETGGTKVTLLIPLNL
ncbi:MAG: tetratricopeptide repeat protein [Crocinitomicaceae bacterium]